MPADYSEAPANLRSVMEERGLILFYQPLTMTLSQRKRMNSGTQEDLRTPTVTDSSVVGAAQQKLPSHIDPSHPVTADGVGAGRNAPNPRYAGGALLDPANLDVGEAAQNQHRMREFLNYSAHHGTRFQRFRSNVVATLFFEKFYKSITVGIARRESPLSLAFRVVDALLEWFGHVVQACFPLAMLFFLGLGIACY